MKAIGKKIFVNIILLSGIAKLRRLLFQKNKVTIFILHDPKEEKFSPLVKALKKKYNFISMDTFIELKQKNAFHQLPKFPAILTFDDGHQNNFSLLGSIKEHQIPTTIYLCSEIINTKRHFWSNYPVEKSKLENLKKLPNEDMLTELSQYGYNKLKEYSNRQALTLSEIKEMEASGLVSFESHTCYHPILTQLSDEDSKFEITASKNSLEKTLNKHINGFAYPNGDYGDREIEYAKNAGYSYAVTVDNGFNSQSTNNYKLKRICLNDFGSVNENLIKATGLWGIMK